MQNLWMCTKMKKYSKKTILDYVSGADIDDFDIDELESNKDFMLDVIRYTKDKNIYNLCDDSVKYDVSFVEELFKIFKDDPDYLVTILEDFEEKAKDEYEIMDLYILLYNMYRYKSDTAIFAVAIKARVFYEIKKAEYFMAIMGEPDPIARKDMGLGFTFALHEFENMPIVKDFFAEMLLNDIYANIDLETTLHKRFKTTDEILKIGVKKYISNSVYGYDEYLAGYLEASDVTKRLEQRINEIIDEWDCFEYTKCEIILDMINKYAFDCTFYSEHELVMYIAKKFDMPLLLSEYNNSFDDSFNPDDYSIEWYENNFKEYQNEFRGIERKVKKYLSTLEAPDDYVEEEEKNKSKILNFRKIKKDKNEVF